MKTEILIIGGGVVGISAAYFLAKAGRQVTLIEAKNVAAGSSWGNAGLIAPNHPEPIPGPGVLSQGLKWLLDAESPLYIKPRLNLELVRWLWRFRQACNAQAQHRAIPIQRDMQRASLQLFRQIIAQEAIACDFEELGGLLAFRSEVALASGVAHAEMLASRYGLRLQVLDARQARALEPTLHASIIGAIAHQEDAFLTPHRFVFGLADATRRLGANLLQQSPALEFELTRGRIHAVRAGEETIYPQKVILTAGVWSTALARQLGLALPMQAAKGYSISLPRPAASPSRYVIFAERNAVATPMGETLRLAGTLELAGLNTAINQRRVQVLRTAAREYLDLPADLPTGQVWAGLRPVPPDGLPYIGRSRKIENLLIGTGHAMLGLAMGPITGQLLMELALEQPTSLPLAQFSPERFG